jgi:hypothetical protein
LAPASVPKLGLTKTLAWWWNYYVACLRTPFALYFSPSTNDKESWRLHIPVSSSERPASAIVTDWTGLTELLWGWFCTSSAPYYRQGSLKHLIPVPVPVLVRPSVKYSSLGTFSDFFFAGSWILSCSCLLESIVSFLCRFVLYSDALRCTLLLGYPREKQFFFLGIDISFAPSFLPASPFSSSKKGLTFPPRSFSFSYPTLVLPHTSEPISTGVPSHYALLTTHCHPSL